MGVISVPERVYVCVCTCTQGIVAGRSISGEHTAGAEALRQDTAEAVLEQVTRRRARPCGVLSLG